MSKLTDLIAKAETLALKIEQKAGDYINAAADCADQFSMFLRSQSAGLKEACPPAECDKMKAVAARLAACCPDNCCDTGKPVDPNAPKQAAAPTQAGPLVSLFITFLASLFQKLISEQANPTA